MIDSIAVKNYKAFKEAELDIKPITILLGANSVGKSSLLQLLLLLKQTATFGTIDDTCPLKMYGPFTNMGSTSNLFHNHNSEVAIEISVSFRNEKILKEIAALRRDFVKFIYSIPYYFPIKSLLDIRQDLSSGTMTKLIKDRTAFQKHTKDVFDILRPEGFRDFRETLAFIVRNQTEIAPSDIFNCSLKAIMSTYDFLASFPAYVPKNKLSKNTVSITLCQDDKQLKVGGMNVSINGKSLFSFDSSDSFIVNTLACKVLENDTSYIYQHLNPFSNIFDIFNNSIDPEEQSSTFANYFVTLSNIFLKYLKSEFNPSLIQHIKPLRANPQRYYVIDNEKMTPYAPTLDGDKLIEILRDKIEVKNKVNKWLSRYNLSIDIRQSEDVIHHIKIVQNDIELDIPDVGFGISQILPILVQAYCSPKNTITIIEQPEIHLHPILQADVADLLRQSASVDKPIIIETHSEYFLRRIRRRVATKEMSPDDVSINLLNGKTKDRDYTEMEHLDMSSTGVFKWPSDYYDGELYRDLVDFISAQS